MVRISGMPSRGRFRPSANYRARHVTLFSFGHINYKVREPGEKSPAAMAPHVGTLPADMIFSVMKVGKFRVADGLSIRWVSHDSNRSPIGRGSSFQFSLDKWKPISDFYGGIVLAHHCAERAGDRSASASATLPASQLSVSGRDYGDLYKVSAHVQKSHIRPSEMPTLSNPQGD